MPTKEILEHIKQSTVALALLPPEPPADPQIAPFVIFGTGFCIDSGGTLVTCEHVVSAFIKGDIRQLISEISQSDRTKEIWPIRNLEMAIPHALFFRMDSLKNELEVVPVQMTSGLSKMDYDIGLLKLQKHPLFKNGYPYFEIEKFEQLYEGMEIATCGFPLGNLLQAQLGTMTSSFTRGILSSIIPSPNIAQSYVTGFQLNVTATNGNSGGPVFNWQTGKVFAVLQSGPVHPEHGPVTGLAKGESIYKIINDGTLERFHKGPPEIPS